MWLHFVPSVVGVGGAVPGECRWARRKEPDPVVSLSVSGRADSSKRSQLKAYFRQLCEASLISESLCCGPVQYHFIFLHHIMLMNIYSSLRVFFDRIGRCVGLQTSSVLMLLLGLLDGC